MVYGELHHLARRLMSEERPSHTLQATALVHEVWLRIAGEGALAGEDRGELLRLAARAMRHVLVDHARRRATQKRGAGAVRVDPEDTTLSLWENDRTDLLALDEALERLQARDEESASIVELLFFGGLTQEEAGRALGLSERQVEGSWTFARGWLRRELERGA